MVRYENSISYHFICCRPAKKAGSLGLEQMSRSGWIEVPMMAGVNSSRYHLAIFRWVVILADKLETNWTILNRVDQILAPVRVGGVGPNLPVEIKIPIAEGR
jgi:hypothetical protein